MNEAIIENDNYCQLQQWKLG